MDIVCRLCGASGPRTYIGLAVLGIVYTGEPNQVCVDCITKIVRWDERGRRNVS